MARHTINRDILETIRQAGGTGRYEEYADVALRGFGVKVTPQGGIAYYSAGPSRTASTGAGRSVTILPLPRAPRGNWPGKSARRWNIAAMMTSESSARDGVRRTRNRECIERSSQFSQR